MIAIFMLQLLITYDIDIDKYLSPRILNWCEKTVKEMGFKSFNNQGKVISYNKEYIYYRIYLALRVVIRSYLYQENSDPSLELIKCIRGARNQTPDLDVRRIFKEDLDEGVAFEDNNNNRVELENLG